MSEVHIERFKNKIDRKCSARKFELDFGATSTDAKAGAGIRLYECLKRSNFKFSTYYVIPITVLAAFHTTIQ